MQEQRETSVEVQAVSSRSFVCVVVGIVIASAFCSAQRADNIQLGATFVCNGERIYVQNCNIRDLSDNASCLVAHPDRPQKNGLMVYTNESRGSLKELLPKCKQPSAEEVRKANEFQKIQSQKLAANIKKANDELDEADAKVEAAINGGHPLSAEERQMYRCIAAGRDSELCTGKIFSSFLASSINMLLPNAVHEAESGLSLAGHYEGKGGWLIDFDARYASTACWDLNESPLDYTVELKNNLAMVNITSKPKHLLLTARPDGTLVGTGPFTLDGFIVKGGGGGTYSSGTGHWETHTTTTTHEYTPLEASSSGIRSDPTLQQNGQFYTTTSSSTFSTYNPGTPTYTSPGVTYIAKTVNCPQPVLSSKQSAKDMTLGLRMRGDL